MNIRTENEIGELVFWVQRGNTFTRSLFETGYGRISSISIKGEPLTETVEVSYKLKCGRYVRQHEVFTEVKKLMKYIEKIYNESQETNYSNASERESRGV